MRKFLCAFLGNVFLGCILFGFFVYLLFSKKRIRVPKNMFRVLFLFSPIQLFAGDGGWPNEDPWIQAWAGVVMFAFAALFLWYAVSKEITPWKVFVGLGLAVGISVNIVILIIDIFMSVPNWVHLLFFISTVFLFLTGVLMKYRKPVDDDIYGNRDNIGAC